MPVKEATNLGILYAFREDNGTYECLGEVKEAKEMSSELNPYRNLFVDRSSKATSTCFAAAVSNEDILERIKQAVESTYEVKKKETPRPKSKPEMRRHELGEVWAIKDACRDGEIFDKHTGFAMCVVKKIYGPDFHHIINKFAGKCEDEKKVKRSTYEKWGDAFEMAQKRAEEELRDSIKDIIKKELEPYNGRHLDE